MDERRTQAHVFDEIVKRHTFVRLWRPEPFEGCVPDRLNGGYKESSAAFRARIESAIAKAKGGAA